MNNASYISDSKNLLKEGDVIILKNGNSINVEMPECLVYSNRPMSNNRTTAEYQIGTVRSNNANAREIVFAEIVKNIRKQFDDVRYMDNLVSDETIKAFVEDNLPNQEKYTFEISEGKWLVTKTNMTGGGYGHGVNDSYPDGHQVTVRRLSDNGTYDPDGITATFYQTGCFTIMNKEVEVVGQMTPSFS